MQVELQSNTATDNINSIENAEVENCSTTKKEINSTVFNKIDSLSNPVENLLGLKFTMDELQVFEEAQKENKFSKVQQKEKMQYWKSFKSKLRCKVKSQLFREHWTEDNPKETEYDHRSLFIINGKWWIRKKLVWLIELTDFELFMTYIIIANSLTLACTDYDNRIFGDEYVSIRNLNLAELDDAFTYIFLIECLVKILAQGFILHKNSYLKNKWNWLDFFVVCVSTVQLIPVIQANSSLKSLRTLRVLRPLRSIKQVPSMRALVNSLISALPKLLYVCIFLFFILSIFAIFGTHQFVGSQYMRCRMTEEPVLIDNTTMIYEWQINLAASWQCNIDEDCAVQLGYGDGIVHKCGTPLNYPNYTITTDLQNNANLVYQEYIQFDNVVQAAYNIFNSVLMDGVFGQMYNQMDSNNSAVAAIYFMCIQVCFLFIGIQLVLAGIMQAFVEEIEAEDKRTIERFQQEMMKKRFANKKILSENKIQLVEEQQNAEEYESQTYEKQSSRQLLPNINISPEKQLTEIQTNRKPQIFRDNSDDEYENEADYQKEARYRSKNNFLLKYLYKITISPLFNFIMMVVILSNTIALALDDYPQSIKKEANLSICNDFFTFAFLAEMLIKISGLGVKNYIQEHFNIFDSTVVCLSLVDWTLQHTLSAQEKKMLGSLMSSLRCLRLLRALRLARSWVGLQNIIKKLLLSFKDILNYAVLLLLLMYIFALLGQDLFANQFRLDYAYQLVDDVPTAIKEDNILFSPRLNFDNLWNSLVTIYCIMMGKNWNYSIYYIFFWRDDSWWMAHIYFLSINVIGGVTMLNLFTSILLQSFNKKEDVEEEDQNHNKKEENASEQVFQEDQKFGARFKALFTRKAILNFAEQVVEFFQVIRKKKKISEVTVTTQLPPPPANENNLKSPEQPNHPNQDAPFKTKLVELRVLELSNENESFRHMQTLSKQGDRIDLMQSARESEKIQQQIFQRQAERFDSFEMSSIEENKSQISSKKLSLQKNASRVAENSINEEKWKKQNQDTLKFQATLLHYDVQNDMKNEQKQKYPPLYWNSLFVFSPENSFRKACNFTVHHRYFERFIMMLIAISTLNLALQSPLDDPQGSKIQMLNIIDEVMTGFFVAELLFKIVAKGVIFSGNDSFFRKDLLWNLIDFTIVSSAVLSIIFVEVDLNFFKSLRVLRVLRPLRIIARNEGLRLTLSALFKSLPNIVNLMIIVEFFIFLLSILCMTLFAGQFWKCSTGHLSSLQDYHIINGIKNRYECLMFGGEWINPFFNFDHIGQGMLTLFSGWACEGWLDIMWQMIDTNGEEMTPVYDNRRYYCAVTIICCLLLYMIFLNLFIGVVVQSFNIEKEKMTNNHKLTTSQKTWIEVLSLCYSATPKVSTPKSNEIVRDFMIEVCDSKWFDYFILVNIVLNTIVMTIKWYNMPAEIEEKIQIANYFFASVFAIEAVIKIYAHRKNYFKDAWNIFDFCIVITSWTFTILIMSNIPYDLKILQTISRTMRILRLFRLANYSPPLQIILLTLVEASPAILTLGLLLGLLIFMYSIIGISQYAFVTYNDNLNKHANFQTFENAFITLLRSTTETWGYFMNDLMKQRSILYQCDYNADYYSYKNAGDIATGCGSVTAAFFYQSYTVIVTQIFLNLFIAIVINSFLNQNEEAKLPVTTDEINVFIEEWNKFDIEGIGSMECHHIEEFVVALCKRRTNLILNNKSVLRSVIVRRRYIASLDVPTHNSFKSFQFIDVLTCMSRATVEVVYIREQLSKQRKELNLNRQLTETAQQQKERIDKLVQQNLQKDHKAGFVKMINDIQKLDANISHVQNVKYKASKYFSRVQSIDKNNETGMDIVRTSKDYIYGEFMVQVWRMYVRQLQLNEQSPLLIQKESVIKKINNTNLNTSKLVQEILILDQNEEQLQESGGILESDPSGSYIDLAHEESERDHEREDPSVSLNLSNEQHYLSSECLLSSEKSHRQNLVQKVEQQEQQMEDFDNPPLSFIGLNFANIEDL